MLDVRGGCWGGNIYIDLHLDWLEPGVHWPMAASLAFNKLVLHPSQSSGVE